jgi:hypothetical protein
MQPLALLAALLLLLARPARALFVNNSLPLSNASGAILDCADGTYTFSGGRWWAHCVSYGLCAAPLPLGCSGYPAPGACGARLDHFVSIFSSPDLTPGSWRAEGAALRAGERRPGILYRPHLAYSAATGRWVLWANVHQVGVFQGYIAATAASISGPFAVAAPAVNLTRVLATNNCGDFDLWTDAGSGAGYVIYTCGHVMGVEALTPDLLASAGAVSALFPTYFVEAPILFRRGGTYFALFGWCCCFCRQGSGAMAWTAPHALGPWALASSSERPDGDVACVAPPAAGGGGGGGGGAPLRAPLAAPTPADTPNQGCAYRNASAPARADTVSAVRSQQNSLIRLDLEGGRVIWTGNRWGQAQDGIKGHEPQAWLPLTFDAASGAVQPLRWVDAFEI